VTIAIRKAGPADAASLTEISHAAKRYWGYPEHWIQHWSSDLTITADYILSNEVYVAADGDEIHGFYALTVSDEKVELDHLWLRPEYIGQGLGKELFIHALNLAATLGANAVEITADPNAAGFYERMGAVKVGELRSELDGRPRNLPRLVIDPRRS
jgi:GNAT superfamily N-acetyltransferase